jgi:hypothetical protein
MPPVPVTIRLSKLLDERLGEDAANELVNWFNQVDATYPRPLRSQAGAARGRIRSQIHGVDDRHSRGE